MMTSWFTYDFGYSRPYTWGHLIVAVVGSVACAVALWRGRSGLALLAGGLVAWGLWGAYVMLGAIQLNAPMRMPTSTFNASGRVLDLGAGSGRAAVGLALANPKATVTALDLYEGYWGIEANSPERLRANARTAGVGDRVSVSIGDMRTLSFAPATFDAAMSVAALDHLSWADIERTLFEVSRVVKPGGQLLLAGLNSDWRVKLAIPVAMHGHGYWAGTPDVGRWRDLLGRTGFDVEAEGTRPATWYVVARVRATRE